MDLGVLGVVVVVLPSLSDWHRQACVQVQLDKNCFTEDWITWMTLTFDNFGD